MSITVTIGGVATSILSGTLNIVDNINDRSTCSFSVMTTGSISIGQEVVISDTGTTIYGGTIENFKCKKLRTTPVKKIYEITCIDFNQIADRRRVAETYENKSAYYVFNDIVDNYLDDEGVTMGTYPSTTPTLSKANFNYITAAECFQFLQNATGLNWNIDYNKKLNIFYRADNVDAGFTDALDNIIDIEIDQSREEYRNLQWLKAGDGTTEVQTDEKPTPQPDGISRTFLVRYPLAKKPTIKVNSAAVADGDVGINGLDTGKKWYWNKNDNKIVQDTSQTILTSSDTLQVTYQGLIPILIRLDNALEQDDRKAVEGGTGIYEGFSADASIDDRNTAISYASGILDKYDEIPQKLTITTRAYKQAGKIVPVSVSDLSLDDNYLIESVNITDQNGLIFYEINLLSGESFGSWVEFFRRLTASANDYVVQENEVVIRVKRDTETRDRTGYYDIKALTALFPANNLYPANDLYPGTIQSEDNYYD